MADWCPVKLLWTRLSIIFKPPESLLISNVSCDAIYLIIVYRPLNQLLQLSTLLLIQQSLRYLSLPPTRVFIKLRALESILSWWVAFSGLTSDSCFLIILLKTSNHCDLFILLFYMSLSFTNLFIQITVYSAIFFCPLPWSSSWNLHFKIIFHNSPY